LIETSPALAMHGGLTPAPRDAAIGASGIVRCTLPPRLRIALTQGLHGEALPEVHVGQHVVRGERLARADDALGVAVHAPADGVVESVVVGFAHEAAGQRSGTIVLRVDAQPRCASPAAAAVPDAMPAELIRRRIADAGLVGLGGACWPTARKLVDTLDVVMLDGADCEPRVSCDEAVVSERADEVLRGGLLLRRAVGADRLLLAISESMPSGIAAASAAIARHADAGITLVIVPARYPQGEERQLIRSVLGRAVPSGQHPRDVGVLVQNVATAAACWRAVAHGEPLLSRVVTVAGGGVTRPGNYEVAFGTPIAHLLQQAGVRPLHEARASIGGALRGRPLRHADECVTAATRCLFVPADDELPAPRVEVPCIRCGACSPACPAQLQPQLIDAAARAADLDALEALRVRDCILCGVCDVVCPSAIPLAAHFRLAQIALQQRRQDRERADAARARFEARNARLARERVEREALAAARRSSVAAPDAVQAALERARARRLARESGNE
jgi:Na+-translocating ferredoxin:NAD+ oxidoreductase subunit C